MNDAKIVGQAILDIQKIAGDYFSSRLDTFPNEARLDELLGDIHRLAYQVCFSAARLVKE